MTAKANVPYLVSVCFLLYIPEAHDLMQIPPEAMSGLLCSSSSTSGSRYRIQGLHVVPTMPRRDERFHLLQPHCAVNPYAKLLNSHCQTGCRVSAD